MRHTLPFVVGVAIINDLDEVLRILAPYVEAGDPEAVEVSQKTEAVLEGVYKKTVMPHGAALFGQPAREVGG